MITIELSWYKKKQNVIIAIVEKVLALLLFQFGVRKSKRVIVFRWFILDQRKWWFEKLTTFSNYFDSKSFSSQPNILLVLG